MRIYAATDIGRVRKVNEDSCYVSSVQPGLLIVADGMGGHNAGEVASATVVDVLSAELEPLIGKEVLGRQSVISHIDEAVRKANARIKEMAAADPSCAGMGTTVVLALVIGREVYVAHIGDSRAYLVRDGVLTQLTEDHSFVQELLKRGRITEEEAQDHPRKNILTRAVGTDPKVLADHMSFELRQDDRLLLCTDGVTNHVSAEELLDRALVDDPEVACRRIFELANERGGWDNMTLVILNNNSEETL